MPRHGPRTVLPHTRRHRTPHNRTSQSHLRHLPRINPMFKRQQTRIPRHLGWTIRQATQKTRTPQTIIRSPIPPLDSSKRTIHRNSSTRPWHTTQLDQPSTHANSKGSTPTMTNHPAAPQQHCHQCGKAVTPGIDHDTANINGIRWWCPEHCPQCRESPNRE